MESAMSAMNRRGFIVRGGSILVATAVAPSVLAQGAAWPAKPIRYIANFAPGGTTDLPCRMIGEKLALALGQPIVVDNRAGQGGSIGAAELARAVPDGYTIGGGTISSHAINASLYAKLTYDPVKDFAPLIMIATQPNVLVVHPSVPAKNLKEFIDLLKANPNKYAFCSSGNGSSQHISGELFKTMAGVQMQHVPYRGSGAMMPDLLGGTVPVGVDNIATVIQHIRAGKLRGLAVTSKTRAAVAPDIPTMDESGLAGYELTSWQAAFAPAATPAAIVDRLYTEMAKILKTPDIQKRLADLGLEPSGMAPAELTAFIMSEVPRLGKIVKDSGARPD
jgi:tripartite-type tricarboxylate transporter receptor subunit TctC